MLAHLFALQVSYARIGETLEECKVRYGEVFAEQELNGIPAFGFMKSDYLIMVTFHGGYASSVTIGKTSQEKITANEIDILLKANGGEKQWIELPDDSWKTEDGEILANYMDPVLVVTTADFEKLLDEATKREEAEKLDGF